MSDFSSAVADEKEAGFDWAQLDPCPNCGKRPHDAPEGCDRDGNPHYTFPSCFACGFRPAYDEPSRQVDRQQYEQFQKWYNEQEALKHPSVNYPAPEPSVSEPAPGTSEPAPPAGFERF